MSGGINIREVRDALWRLALHTPDAVPHVYWHARSWRDIAFDALRALDEKRYAYIYRGSRYDIGNKIDWIKSNIELFLKDERLTFRGDLQMVNYTTGSGFVHRRRLLHLFTAVICLISYFLSLC